MKNFRVLWVLIEYIIYIRFCSTNFITVNFNKLASHWAKVNSSIHPSSTAVIIIRCCNRTIRSRRDRESEKVLGGEKICLKTAQKSQRASPKTAWSGIIALLRLRRWPNGGRDVNEERGSMRKRLANERTFIELLVVTLFHI